MIALCDNSLLEINNEVEKLLLFCKNKDRITSEDVQDLTGDIKGFDIFKLIDAVLSSQLDLSLRIFNKLFNAGNTPSSLFGLLNKSLHDIFLLKFLLEIKKMNSGEIIKKLRMNSYRYKKLTANIKTYNLGRVSRIISALFEFDYKLKSYTAYNKKRLFEKLIFSLKLK